MVNEPAQFEEFGNRLKQIRSGFSHSSQSVWAKSLNFNVTQYNNWEKGIRKIPVDAAIVLCDRYGLTLDAIYRGRLDGIDMSTRMFFSTQPQ